MADETVKTSSEETTTGDVDKIVDMVLLRLKEQVVNESAQTAQAPGTSEEARTPEEPQQGELPLVHR